jgi:hypothetical protein
MYQTQNNFYNPQQFNTPEPVPSKKTSNLNIPKPPQVAKPPTTQLQMAKSSASKLHKNFKDA